MSEQNAMKTTLLKDYQKPDFVIDKVNLEFKLDPQATIVTNTLEIKANPEIDQNDKQIPSTPLKLHGEELELLEITLDGDKLAADGYEVNDKYLTITNVPTQFELQIKTKISPAANTSLSGLYLSHDMFCTQCEAEGFRKITYYLDRPDIMALFTTTITAECTQFPVLLSNGNLIAQGQNEDGTHWVTWHDPFKKPSYLFALVAGDLACIKDSFMTCSGREVTLKMYVEQHDVGKCNYALDALKRAMRWDEQKYGREYDLDIFMIVAVSHFNMGAMENKGLNIFNTSCVLADPKTTTDLAFRRVESVVAHEYFHNWSGNRVTCRDWFQLSLKEGFTVFRDQQFSADMGSATVQRVEDVRMIRTYQFSEDAGPMAHPVRPEAYIEINNFYTVTIYEKGAEVVRMLHTFLGADRFRQGTDLYFERHDGQAVTIEDFLQAMVSVSDINLDQFHYWYNQAGTPTLSISDHYDQSQECYQLTVRQSCPNTPEQKHKNPFLIPLRMALLNSLDGTTIALNPMDFKPAVTKTDTTQEIIELVIPITKTEQTFTFSGVTKQPIPSLLRGFSAPVKLEFDFSQAQRAFLMQYDTDGFNRWEACHQLALTEMLRLVTAYEAQQEMQVSTEVIEAFRYVLDNRQSMDQEEIALMLALPTPAYIAEVMQPINVTAVLAVEETFYQQLTTALLSLFQDCYQHCCQLLKTAKSIESMAFRRLKNQCLSYLMKLPNRTTADVGFVFNDWAEQQFDQADNMTEQFGALKAIVHSKHPNKELWLERFFKQWSDEDLVVDQWFSVQVTSPYYGTLPKVNQLLAHPCFELTHPNKVRAVLGAFCQNWHYFHADDGSGYEFLAQQVLQLDSINPQIAARLLIPLTRGHGFDHVRQNLMQQQLAHVLAQQNLSPDVFEVAKKSVRP